MIRALFVIPKSAEAVVSDGNLIKFSGPDGQPIPGLRSVMQSDGPLMSPSGPPPYGKVIELTFDSLDEVMAHVQSEAVQGGKAQLLGSGILVLMYEVNEVPLGVAG